MENKSKQVIWFHTKKNPPIFIFFNFRLIFQHRRKKNLLGEKQNAEYKIKICLKCGEKNLIFKRKFSRFLFLQMEKLRNLLFWHKHLF